MYIECPIHTYIVTINRYIYHIPNGTYDMYVCAVGTYSSLNNGLAIEDYNLDGVRTDASNTGRDGKFRCVYIYIIVIRGI